MIEEKHIRLAESGISPTTKLELPHRDLTVLRLTDPSIPDEATFLSFYPEFPLTGHRMAFFMGESALLKGQGYEGINADVSGILYGRDQKIAHPTYHQLLIGHTENEGGHGPVAEVGLTPIFRRLMADNIDRWQKALHDHSQDPIFAILPEVVGLCQDELDNQCKLKDFSQNPQLDQVDSNISTILQRFLLSHQNGVPFIERLRAQPDFQGKRFQRRTKRGRNFTKPVTRHKVEGKLGDLSPARRNELLFDSFIKIDPETRDRMLKARLVDASIDIAKNLTPNKRRTLFKRGELLLRVTEGGVVIRQSGGSTVTVTGDKSCWVVSSVDLSRKILANPDALTPLMAWRTSPDGRRFLFQDEVSDVTARLDASLPNGYDVFLGGSNFILNSKGVVEEFGLPTTIPGRERDQQMFATQTSLYPYLPFEDIQPTLLSADKNPLVSVIESGFAS